MVKNQATAYETVECESPLLKNFVGLAPLLASDRTSTMQMTQDTLLRTHKYFWHLKERSSSLLCVLNSNLQLRGSSSLLCVLNSNLQLQEAMEIKLE